jgi:hypothetical protein
MMPRNRSRDALGLQNGLRDAYKQMVGANNIVAAGRLESQRLLLDHYRKVEPINMKRQNQVYIPLSQHGYRNSPYNAGSIPQSR